MKKVIVEISARHIHISRAHLDKLFGKNYKLKKLRTLSQPGEFATQGILTVIGPKMTYKIRIVGPTRAKTQVELSVTDCRRLGIEPVFRVSGDHKGTGGGLTLKGPNGSIKLTSGVIVPHRHLHISTKQAKAWGLKNRQAVRAIVKGGPRPLIFDNIVVRTGNYSTSIHLDTDEANAAGLLACSKIDLDI